VGGELQGAVGLERHGRSALLRSRVVHPDARGAGAGAALLQHAVIEATRSGAVRVAALTTTIASWLEREGWMRVARNQLPAELASSQELQGACPASAVAFVLELAKPPLAA
jgi:amino-acid N-acetyltransferase